MITLLISLCLAYLLGSISPSYLIGTTVYGKDLRKFGSGNLGATNTFRVLGKVPGTIVLTLDILKGWVAVGLFPKWFQTPAQLFHDPIVYPILLGLAAIAGHNWTIFLKFRGGKGVATTCGVFLGLDPLICVLSFGFWFIGFRLGHKVSIGSLVAAFFLPILMLLFHRPLPLSFFTWVLAISAFYTHRSNIREVFFRKRDITHL